MAGTIAPSPWFTGLDDNGVSVIGGKLYTYAAGTSTPLATYADVSLSVANPNPTILDGGGRATLFLEASSYKFVLKDANDVTIRTQDNIAATAPFSVDLDIAGVAGENLPAGSVVYLSVGTGGTTAGRWYLADADLDYASAAADFIAMVQEAIFAGHVGAFRLQGRTTVPGPLTIGATYFVSQTAGGLVTPAPLPPAFERLVGIADTITTIVSATGFGENTIIGGDVNINGNVAISGQTSLDDDLVFVGNYSVRRNTVDGSDTGFLTISGGGGPFGSLHDWTRGAFIRLHGNEDNGILALGSGDNPAGAIQFITGGGTRGAMFASGGFSWGGYVPEEDDPGEGGFTVKQGTLEAGRGMLFTKPDIVPPNKIILGNVHPTGGMSWGGNTYDSGVGTIFVAGPNSPGSNDGTLIRQGEILLANPTFAQTFVLAFWNGTPSQLVGAVTTTDNATQYLTSSDASLKDDRGLVTETDVLARVRVHDFDWKTGGSGRGVFAQEVRDVLPRAVGGAEGALGVDYSKLVPDLVVGWQAHEARILSLLQRLEALESRHDG